MDDSSKRILPKVREPESDLNVQHSEYVKAVNSGDLGSASQHAEVMVNIAERMIFRMLNPTTNGKSVLATKNVPPELARAAAEYLESPGELVAEAMKDFDPSRTGKSGKSATFSTWLGLKIRNKYGKALKYHSTNGRLQGLKAASFDGAVESPRGGRDADMYHMIAGREPPPEQGVMPDGLIDVLEEGIREVVHNRLEVRSNVSLEQRYKSVTEDLEIALEYGTGRLKTAELGQRVLKEDGTPLTKQRIHQRKAQILQELHGAWEEVVSDHLEARGSSQLDEKTVGKCMAVAISEVIMELQEGRLPPRLPKSEKRGRKFTSLVSVATPRDKWAR